MTVKAVRIRPGPGPAREHAHRIAEKVCDAWFGRHGSGDLEIPLSVVAVLSMLNPPYQQQNAMATALINADMDEWVTTIRVMWGEFVRHRPDLVNRAWPLMEPWHGERAVDDPHTLRAAKQVSDAVLLADLLGWNERKREDYDLLGIVITMLRPKSALQARGQYYTPPELCDLMAEMTDVKEGQSIAEPTVATGGMLRAVAKSMRQRGRDPRTCYWEGVDLDYLAVACCAVNVVVWGLGFKVLLGVGNGLTDEWRHRAIQERAETIGVHRDMTMLRLLNEVTGQVDRAATDVESTDDDEGATADDELAGPIEPEPEPVDEPHPDSTEADGAELDEDQADDEPATTPVTEPAGELIVRPVPAVASVLAGDEPPPIVPVDEAAEQDFWALVDQVGG